MVISNSLPFITEIAAKAKKPASIKYGTRACPASEKNELAILARFDKISALLAPVLDGITGIEIEGELDDFLKKQLENLKAAFSSDPLVFTASVTDTRLEFLARLDLKEHDGVRKFFGKPSPMRLARALPENSLGMLSLRINYEWRERFQEALGDKRG